MHRWTIQEPRRAPDDRGAPTIWTDMNAKTVNKLWKDGTRESSNLVQGPTGFAIALFGGETHTTEVPNLLLRIPPTKKRPASAEAPSFRLRTKTNPSMMKAAKVEENGSGQVGKKESSEKRSEKNNEEEEEEERAWGRMYYKKVNSVGIRERFGRSSATGQGKQIFSFGNKNCGKNRDALWAIGAEVIKKLLDGCSYDDAKEFAQELVNS